MRVYLLIYFLPSAFATIDVTIAGSFHTNFTSLISGNDKAIVDDSERASFNFTDKIVKDCVKNFLGGRPDDAFIHGPTPWGDLYKKYGWTAAYRILAPISSRIVNVASSPQMLKQQIIDTNQTNAIKFSQTVYNRFSTTWFDAANLTVKQINNHIYVDNFKMSYESAVGVNGVKLKAMTTGVSINDLLDFGSVSIELYATRVSVKTEVVYQAKLWGNLVLNYAKSFRGHHFYSPNLEDIMFDCGLTNSLEIKEVIDIGFYTDAKVVVRSKGNGLMMMTKNVEIYSL